MFPEVILDQTLSLKLMFGRVLALIKIPPYLTLSRGEGYNQVFELKFWHTVGWEYFKTNII